MRKIFQVFALSMTVSTLCAQDLFDPNTYLMFANNSARHFSTYTLITGTPSKVSLGQASYIPWEVSNNHDFGDQVTAVILGAFFSIDPHHSERKYIAKCNRDD